MDYLQLLFNLLAGGGWVSGIAALYAAYANSKKTNADVLSKLDALNTSTIDRVKSVLELQSEALDLSNAKLEVKDARIRKLEEDLVVCEAELFTVGVSAPKTKPNQE